MTLVLDEANKLAQELSERKMQLKAAMFNDKLASFVAFPSMGETCMGELAFSTIRLPFKTLDIANNELTPIDIRVDYDFVLPLEHGQRIVAFKWYYTGQFATQKYFMRMSCFDQLGRLIGTDNLDYYVKRQNVAQCGPNQFVVFYDVTYNDESSVEFKLSVYNSSLHRLRSVDCNKFTDICCNSKFIFGLCDAYESDDEDGSEDNDDEPEEEECARTWIQVCHLDTLRTSFCLVVSDEYTIERIMSDEHHVVAMSRPKDSELLSQWFISIFNLATCNESGVGDFDNSNAKLGGDETASTKFFLAEKTIDLPIESYPMPRVFLFNGWLVVPLKDEQKLIWFDKEVELSETITKWDSNRFKDFFPFGSGLLFTQHDSKILLKR